MSKVVKIFLHNGFTPINHVLLKLGVSLEFDCYIQRFNGFAILIKAGTPLDEKTYQKILDNKLQIFVENSEYPQYVTYAKQSSYKQIVDLYELDITEESEKVFEVRKIIENEPSTHEKLKTIYLFGKNLLNAWLNGKDKIPKEALVALTEVLIDTVNEEHITLSHFNSIIENRYSLATHLLNVAFFTAMVSTEILMDMTDQKNLVLSALLHDIGKSDIDEALLDKPDMLTDEEFEIIKSHSERSVKLASINDFKDRDILKAISDHHERLDGSGYPHGYKKDRISQFGKILAVCDVFDALITIKPYRGAYTTFNALMQIKSSFKGKLDLKYVTILIKLLK